MDDGAKGWLYKTARKNYWRVAQFYEFDDLVQDGFYWYYFVRQRYPQATERKHIMALFQRCFTNHIHDLAKGTKCYGLGVSGAQKAIPVSWLSPGNTEAAEGVYASAPCPDAELLRFVVEAPAHVRACLKALLAAPEKLRAPLRKRLYAADESFNEQLCNIAGLPYHPTLMDDLLAYLGACRAVP